MSMGIKTKSNWLGKFKSTSSILLALIASGCASTGDQHKVEPVDHVTTNRAEADKGMTDKATVKNKAEADASFDSRVGSAITSPLGDLNLMRTEIPPVLIQARKTPYTFPSDASCVWFTSEIQGLDLVLGPDLDAAKVDAKGNIVEKELGNATVNALKSFTEGFVPFRSWVRRITGADSHAKEVAAAGMAGIVRRSYLKGVASARACRLDPVPGMTTPQADNQEPAQK